MFLAFQVWMEWTTIVIWCECVNCLMICNFFPSLIKKKVAQGLERSSGMFPYWKRIKTEKISKKCLCLCNTHRRQIKQWNSYINHNMDSRKPVILKNWSNLVSIDRTAGSKSWKMHKEKKAFYIYNNGYWIFELQHCPAKRHKILRHNLMLSISIKKMKKKNKKERYLTHAGNI